MLNNFSSGVIYFKERYQLLAEGPSFWPSGYLDGVEEMATCITMLLYMDKIVHIQGYVHAK